MTEPTPQIFDVARRTILIGRQKELSKIAHAVFADGDECRIVLLVGEGGLGKTRLLEEVRDRLEAHKDWPEYGRDDYPTVTVSDIVDFDNILTSVRSNLLFILSEALTYSKQMEREKDNRVDFTDYERAADEFKAELTRSASATNIRSAIERAEAAFWQDFAMHTNRHGRIVLLLDTAERLVHRASRWLEENKLLGQFPSIRKILNAVTSQWLIRQIESGHFNNTTLIIAGRNAKDEGGPFFDQLMALEKQGQCSIETLELESFSLDETKEYVKQLGEIFQNNIRIRDTLTFLQDNSALLERLQIYTGGKPVLLSLYVDIIYDTEADLSGTLQPSLPATDKRMNAAETDILRNQIEQQFVNIVHREGQRARILQALVRCPLGLDEEQLHFLLGDFESPDAWYRWRDNTRGADREILEIEQAIEQLQHLAILKWRSNGRLGMQDELYRIYDHYIADDPKLRNDERKARQRQYRKLQAWAEHKLQYWNAKRQEYQERDEQRLKIGTPSDALIPRFPHINRQEQDQRLKIHQKVREWELERLHYALLRDPSVGFNDAYTDLVESMWRTQNLEADMLVQIEAWRILRPRGDSENAMEGFSVFTFTDLNKDPEQQKALLRFAEQDDVARWIKRLIVEEAYQEILEFVQTVEETVAKIKDTKTRQSWKHTLAKGERIILTGYAKILLGKNIEKTQEEILEYLKKLERLATTNRDTPAVLGEEQNWEHGFLATDQLPDHPALPRLYRVLAVGYNYLGYGYVVQGQYAQGVKYYVRALYHMRNTKFQSQETVTRNNLGRALASLGREERGYRICADALELRRQMGQIIPIAYSLNTLALINNGMDRTKRAWYQAARAAAYFRRAQNNRGLGLSLIQLSTALRRLAMQKEPGEILTDDPQQIFGTANDAIREAVIIFSERNKRGEFKEPLRLAEAYIELGSLTRDQIVLLSFQEKHKKRYAADARIELMRAHEIAKQYEFRHLELEARVDYAWTYYYADDMENASKELNDILLNSNLLPPDYQITGKELPPGKDKTYLYYEQSKMCRLRMLIAFREFSDILSRAKEDIKQNDRPLWEQDKDQFYRRVFLAENKDALESIDKILDALRESARAAVLSLLYGQLFSPRSRALVLTYNALYNRLKKFNVYELDAFGKYQEEARKTYPAPEEILGRSYNFSELGPWLIDNFGVGSDIDDTRSEERQK